MSRIDQLTKDLRRTPRTWLVTGVAGFIGSNLLEELLRRDQQVIGLDDFSTGRRENLDLVRAAIGKEAWTRFRFVEGDIRVLDHCRRASEGVDYVLHQAALGSVPRSIARPLDTNAVNVDGFLNILAAARDAKVKQFVYASSSSVYGDHPGLPKVEEQTGRPLSPYAVSKATNELYADVFARQYGMRIVGLRYFNVFGPRQDPAGPYAAVVPRWIEALLAGEPTTVYGDGETSRDFCYIANAVQANLLAAMAEGPGAVGEVYNVAYGERTSLNELHRLLAGAIAQRTGRATPSTPIHQDFRPGDIRHSLADTSKIARLLGYAPTHSVREGIEETVEWYWRAMRRNA
jgi:UDP-N-acetylglucosamine/UDP-N-acetyl-alpha-D-glucosaminouronate 4-epimerase